MKNRSSPTVPVSLTMRKYFTLLATACLMPMLTGAEVTTVAFIPRAEEVDRAIERGLTYLKSAQSENGAFIGKHGRTGGVVALCGMAFLSKGHTPGHGPYGDAINGCIDYVLSLQRGDGMLAVSGATHGPLYSHNIATLFLSEASGMADQERQGKINRALDKGVRLILVAQAVSKPERHRGGWRYQPESHDSDLSCSGWALMALRSTRLNGAPVPDAAIENARTYIMQNRDPTTGRFGYQDGARHATTLTGAAVLCLELTGSHGGDETSKAGDYILKTHRDLPRMEFPYYGTYYTAQGMFQLGGSYWQRFATWMYDYWLPLQKKDGSWEILPNCWMAKNGKDELPYVTAMAVLSFAVPYRQLPIYQRDETVDELAE